MQMHMTKLQRALQVWQVLISAAHNRQVLTYKIISALIGVGMHGSGAIAMGPYLAVLMRYCKSHKLPPITALVVQKGSGRPGSGLTTLSNYPDRDREMVFAYDWFKLKPLEAVDLKPFLGNSLDNR
jgi:hypothetical protein